MTGSLDIPELENAAPRFPGALGAPGTFPSRCATKPSVTAYGVEVLSDTPRELRLV